MIANESASFSDMLDGIRFESQKTGENGVCGDGIIAKQNRVKFFGRAAERAITFHSDNPICNHKARTNGRTDIEDAFVNSSPVMGFHLWHRHDEIRRQDGTWEPQMTKTGNSLREALFLRVRHD